MATINNLTSGIEVTFAGAVTYIKHSNVKLLKRGTNLNIYDNSDDDGSQRGQAYITIPYSEVTSPITANINELYTAVKGYIDVSSGGGGGSQQPFTFTAVNYTDLLTKTGMSSGDVAYVNDAQGTQWLPGTIGGNYYPNGIYLYTGGSWTSDRNAISYELHLDDVRLDALEARLQLTDGDKGDVTVSSLGTVWDVNPPSVNSVVTATTLTPNVDQYDQEDITDLASALTIAAPTGTPSVGMKLIIRLTDNGTNRALTWNNIYRVIGVTLPTTTTADKILYIGCIYDEAGSKWDVVAIKEEVY